MRVPLSARVKESPTPTVADPFVSVPWCALRDRNLLGNDLRVYAVLLFLSGDSKQFSDGLDTIAEWSSLSKRTANRSVRRLTKMGYIEVRRRQRQTSVIVVRPPFELYGEAVFDLGIKPLKVRRHKSAACPALSRKA